VSRGASSAGGEPDAHPTPTAAGRSHATRHEHGIPPVGPATTACRRFGDGPGGPRLRYRGIPGGRRCAAPSGVAARVTVLPRANVSCRALRTIGSHAGYRCISALDDPPRRAAPSARMLDAMRGLHVCLAVTSRRVEPSQSSGADRCATLTCVPCNDGRVAGMCESPRVARAATKMIGDHNSP